MHNPIRLSYVLVNISGIRKKKKRKFTWNVSPADSQLIIKTVDQTGHATSGIPAASFRETPDGTRRTCPAGTATFSAYPPPERRAHTCIPQTVVQTCTMYHVYYELVLRRKQNHIQDSIKIGAFSPNH